MVNGITHEGDVFSYDYADAIGHVSWVPDHASLEVAAMDTYLKFNRYGTEDEPRI